MFTRYVILDSQIKEAAAHASLRQTLPQAEGLLKHVRSLDAQETTQVIPEALHEHCPALGGRLRNLLRDGTQKLVPID
jgi:hypothetical protein